MNLDYGRQLIDEQKQHLKALEQLQEAQRHISQLQARQDRVVAVATKYVEACKSPFIPGIVSQAIIVFLEDLLAALNPKD